MSYIKCMIMVCLTIFFSILSPFQDVSYINKVHDYCVFDYFPFDFVTISDGELQKVHDYCAFDHFSSILSPFQSVSYIKCVIIVCLTISLQFCHHFRR